MSRKYAPPFATLASVQNAGGAYTWDATISLAITPSLPVPVKHDLIVGGDQARGIAKREAERGFTKFTQLHVVTSQFVMVIPCALHVQIEDRTGSTHGGKQLAIVLQIVVL